MKKKILENKKKVLIIGGITFVFLLLLLTLKSFSFSKIEKVKINELNNKISNYIDEVISNPNDEGKYVCYAIEYLYNTTDKKTFTYDEVLKEINNTFMVDYTEKDLNKIGISIEMANKGIVQDSNNKKYIYENNKTVTDIASTPLVKYVAKKARKFGISKYKVTYEKYIVENPYELLNYYDNYNLIHKKKIDTNLIKEYLKGNTKIGIVKDFISKDNIKKIGKITGKETITYIIKNNKILISKIG